MKIAARPRERELRRSYDLIAGRLAEVENELMRLCDSPVTTISKIGDYLRSGGGKRIRPALLLLSAKLLGYEEGNADIRYAAVVEFIHAATLVHDDIIDEAKLRRGRESVNARWGNNLTVLFGDYLYTKSMGVALEEGNLAILKILSSTTLTMIEGEIIGLEREGDVELDPEGALGIIRRKTAELFSAACRIPAHFSPDGGAEASERLGEYGRRLGISFQLIDDLLDYTARESVLGKPVLSDLREGKLTMPLILSLPRAAPAERAKIARVLKERKFESVSPFEVLAIVDRYDGIARTRDLALANARAASEPLAGFPASEAKEALLFAAEGLVERIS
jgi:octaprenyl-diphosphate synthase